MNVLSLFDGISCGRLALERAGIVCDRYFASEIEESAMAITRRNHPDTVFLGDVTGYQSWDLPKIDLVLAGSPCQGFSSAGRKLGFGDERSSLFYVFETILGEVLAHNPEAHFLTENVVMKTPWRNTFSGFLMRNPVRINSSLVSAQSRNRDYWASWSFGAPEDRGLTMADILEPGFWSPQEKSYCIDANFHKGSNFRQFFYKSRRSIALEEGFDPRPGMTPDNANDIGARERGRWRNLTVLECERLQTLPEGYTRGVSVKDRFHAIGNGWTVDVIAHILGQGPFPRDGSRLI